MEPSSSSVDAPADDDDDNPPEYPETAPPAAADQPPVYREDSGADPDEILPPCTFVLHGRFVYRAHASASEADSEPAYQLSRVIHTLGRATESIEFQRLEYRVRSAADGSPLVVRRAKDVYLLHQRRLLLYPHLPPELRLEPMSRKTVGQVQIVKSPLFHHGFRAMRVLSDAERNRLEKEQAKKGKKMAEYHFVMTGNRRDETWQWRDPEGVLVASQERVRPREGAEGVEVEHRLRVVIPLSRRVLDSLVAMWCMWLWDIHVANHTPRKTWEDRKRILQQPRIGPR